MIPSSIYQIVSSHLDRAMFYTVAPNNFSEEERLRIFNELRASVQQYVQVRMSNSTRIYSLQVRETFWKCDEIKEIWLQSRSQDNRDTLYCYLRIMQNCLDTCENEWLSSLRNY